MSGKESNICMLCEEESSELIDVTVTNDEGEIVPATINGKKYESIVICPNCMGHFFGKGDEE